MIFQARTAHPEITLGGKNFYSAIAPYFLKMTFTDNCDGKKGDDFSLELADRDMRFISDWMPQKGVFLDASIIAERWFAPNAPALSLDCGRFWIDTVEFKLPDYTVEIKASSIPTDGHIKAVDETRGWEKTTLQDIANQIASENNITVDWQSDHNPRYHHVEQVEESGLAFLHKRAEDQKIAIKVHRGKIIFYDEAKLEAAAAQFSVVFGSTAPPAGLRCYRMSGGHFTTKLVDTLKKATVAHSSTSTGQMSKEMAEDSDPNLPSSWDTNIPQGTDGEDEDGEDDGEGGDGDSVSLRDLPNQWDSAAANASGQLKAQSELRKKNKEKDKSKIDLSIGNPLVAAGMTFNLVGVGQFDGKYFVESVHHVVAPEFTTELTVRRCLTGY